MENVRRQIWYCIRQDIRVSASITVGKKYFLDPWPPNFSVGSANPWPNIIVDIKNKLFEDGKSL